MFALTWNCYCNGAICDTVWRSGGAAWSSHTPVRLRLHPIILFLATKRSCPAPPSLHSPTQVRTLTHRVSALAAASVQLPAHRAGPVMELGLVLSVVKEPMGNFAFDFYRSGFYDSTTCGH